MDSQKAVLEKINNYQQRFPEKKEETKHFFDFVSHTEGEHLYSRKNVEGHITASGIIINKEKTKVLLLKHKQLGLWLVPGGHVDATDVTILEAAYREIKEETGIDSENLTLLINEPIEIDSHIIPENITKREKEHFHYDFRYLFIFNGEEKEVKFDKTESDDIEWIDLLCTNKYKQTSSFIALVNSLLQNSGLLPLQKKNNLY